MQRYIGVGGVRLQALADHERGLAVRHGTGSNKPDVGGERYIARHLLPCELEGVGRGPDVVAASGDPILAGGGIELDLTFSGRHADVAARLELSQTLREAECGGATESERA